MIWRRYHKAGGSMTPTQWFRKEPGSNKCRTLYKEGSLNARWIYDQEVTNDFTSACN